MSTKQISSNLEKTTTDKFVYFYSPDVNLWFEWNKSQTVNVQATKGGQDIDCFSGSYGNDAKGVTYFKRLIVNYIKESFA